MAEGPFTILGFGVENVQLAYDEATLSGARRLASKMADNGVKAVQILDRNGARITLREGMNASQRDPLLQAKLRASLVKLRRTRKRDV